MNKLAVLLFVIITLAAFSFISCGDSDPVASGMTADNGEAPAEDGSKEDLDWLSFNLAVDELREINETDNLQISTPPEGSRYIVVRLLSTGEQIPASDITDQNTELIILKTPSGDEFIPCNTILWGIKFDPSAGTFSTAEFQEGFQLLYIVPDDIGTEDLTVSIR